MPNGSNCTLNHGAQLNSYSGCIQTELLLYMCKWHVSNTLYKDVYENGNKVCIIAFALNFIDTKGF